MDDKEETGPGHFPLPPEPPQVGHPTIHGKHQSGSTEIASQLVIRVILLNLVTFFAAAVLNIFQLFPGGSLVAAGVLLSVTVVLWAPGTLALARHRQALRLAHHLEKRAELLQLSLAPAIDPETEKSKARQAKRSPAPPEEVEARIEALQRERRATIAEGRKYRVLGEWLSKAAITTGVTSFVIIVMTISFSAAPVNGQPSSGGASGNTVAPPPGFVGGGPSGGIFGGQVP